MGEIIEYYVPKDWNLKKCDQFDEVIKRVYGKDVKIIFHRTPERFAYKMPDYYSIMDKLNKLEKMIKELK